MKSNKGLPAERPPQERLIEAAIEQIEQRGLGRLTVRAVAAAAGVNVAAVNYYFRSKDALTAAALESTIRHMVADCEAFLEPMASDPERAITDLLGYIFEGALRFPRISKAHLHAAFTSDDYTGPFPTLFSPFMLRLRRELRAAVPGLAEQAAGQRVAVALSAVFFPGFFGGLYEGLNAFDTAPARAQYVRELARQALAPTVGSETKE